MHTESQSQAIIWLACGSLVCIGVSYCASGDMLVGGAWWCPLRDFLVCLMVVVSGCSQGLLPFWIMF